MIIIEKIQKNHRKKYILEDDQIILPIISIN